jgi:hypothetical protein
MGLYLDHHRAIGAAEVRFQATGCEDLGRLLLFDWSFHFAAAFLSLRPG